MSSQHSVQDRLGIAIQARTASALPDDELDVIINRVGPARQWDDVADTDKVWIIRMEQEVEGGLTDWTATYAPDPRVSEADLDECEQLEQRLGLQPPQRKALDADGWAGV